MDRLEAIAELRVLKARKQNTIDANTYLIENNNEKIEYNKKMRACNKQKIEAIDQAIQDMQAIADGRMVELPCRDGQTVYAIDDGIILQAFIGDISISYANEKERVKFNCLLPEYNHDDYEFYLSDWNTTVFLTKESAQNALKEAGEG